MTKSTPQVVRSYLSQLETELADVPASVRSEIVSGVSEELAGLDPAAAAARIDQLGDPAFIAAEARAEAGAPAEHSAAGERTEPAWFAVVASLLVAVGSFVVPVIGWVVGIVMVWLSKAWWRWEKLVATLLVPGIILLVVGLGWLFSLGGATSGQPNPLVPSHIDLLTIGLLPYALNVVVGLWLLYRARRTGRPRP